LLSSKDAITSKNDQEREPKAGKPLFIAPKRNRVVRHRMGLPAHRPDSLVRMTGCIRCIVAIACKACCSSVRSKLQKRSVIIAAASGRR
jgi:ribosomal protein S12